MRRPVGDAAHPSPVYRPRPSKRLGGFLPGHSQTPADPSRCQRWFTLAPYALESPVRVSAARCPRLGSYAPTTRPTSSWPG